MLVSDYNKFVHETDQYADKPEDQRKDIALYGLVGEIGSVLSAVKKQLLSEGGIESWDHANEEIIEELGDVIWYCFSLAQIHNKDRSINIFIRDVALLKKEIGAPNDRAKKIRGALDPTKRDQFLREAVKFPNTKDMYFDDYQKLAFLTARTDGKVLLEVCLSVLWQLGAELLRKKLPEIELTLNKSVIDRDTNIVLGEIAWHLAAITSVYGLSLNLVAATNVKKVSFRMRRDNPTQLHDDNDECPTSQRFPRKMEIAFITVNKGRSRMYFEGKKLGNDLTDNSYDDDGYRFHDVMHLANVSKLGWSPVLRSLLKRKRKYDDTIDEVEDGARATIIEEAIVKVIHSEGVRLAKYRNRSLQPKPVRLFSTKDDVTFKFLKFIRNLVTGLEVAKNKYWEWEDAIMDGYNVFYELCKEEQGTVTIDLDERTLAFRPDVYIDIKGTVSGIGSALINADELREGSETETGVSNFLITSERAVLATNLQFSKFDIARIIAVKQAIFEALGIQNPQNMHFQMLHVRLINQKSVSIKASGEIQTEIWRQNIVNFKTTLTQSQSNYGCTALAISDPSDSLK